MSRVERRPGAVGQRDGDDERAVDAGAEARGEPVVGLALGGVGVRLRSSGWPELEAGRGRGERDGHGAGGREREHRPLGRPGRARGAGGRDGCALGALAPRQQLRPARAKRAGSRTTHTIAQASTTSPAATPARPTNGMPVTSRPEIETSTMPAAVSAECPAVALARSSRLERAVAGAQLLLLAGGEQQRVVDAGAEPEHAAERRREPGHVGRGGGPHQRAEAEADAGERGTEGVARGAQVAQHGDQQQDGDGEADHLADREPAGGGAVDRLAGHRDVDARPLEAGGGVLEPVASGRVEIGRGLVVADRREGGAAVVREPAGGLEGVLDRGDVRLAARSWRARCRSRAWAGPLERASPV